MHRTPVLVVGLLSMFALFAVLAMACLDEPQTGPIVAAASPSEPPPAPAASAQPLPAPSSKTDAEPVSKAVRHILSESHAVALAKPSLGRTRSTPAVWERSGKGHTFMKPPINRHAGKRKAAATKPKSANPAAKKKPAAPRPGAKKQRAGR